MGFPRDVAERLVLQTVKGSLSYLEKSECHIAQLRNDITSPGGTTAAAIYTSDRGGFKTTISDSLWAAYRRSLELGGKDSNVGPGRRALFFNGNGGAANGVDSSAPLGTSGGGGTSSSNNAAAVTAAMASAAHQRQLEEEQESMMR